MFGMTFSSSFLSLLKALIFLPRPESSVMSPVRDLPDKMSCLFLWDAAAFEQIPSPCTARALRAVSPVCLFLHLPLLPIGDDWLTADAHQC